MDEHRAGVVSPGEHADVAWLERGWIWLEANPGHPRYLPFEDEWLRRLRLYERTYRLVHLS